MNNSLLELPDYNRRHRILRIPLNGKPLLKEGKRYLSGEEVDLLLDGEVVIEEKLDGKQLAKKFLDIDRTEGEEFLALYGEFMKYIHSINYDSLPSWFILWDIYSPKKNYYYNYDERAEFCSSLGATMPPLIYRGKVKSMFHLADFLDRKSTFGHETQEGIVVKNYSKQMFGKIVREEFVAGIELKGHWLRSKGLAKMNRLEVRN